MRVGILMRGLYGSVVLTTKYRDKDDVLIVRAGQSRYQQGSRDARFQRYRCIRHGDSEALEEKVERVTCRHCRRKDKLGRTLLRLTLFHSPLKTS
jgi:hypothetical protein